MTDDDNILAERMNVEPPIFRGCSSSELGLIVTLAAAIWLPLSLLLAWSLGATSMGFGLAGIAIGATVVVTAGLFQRVKRGPVRAGRGSHCHACAQTQETAGTSP